MYLSWLKCSSDERFYSPCLVVWNSLSQSSNVIIFVDVESVEYQSYRNDAAQPATAVTISHAADWRQT